MKKIKLKNLFTMVELILVIAIIAFLTVTATVVLSQWLSKSRDSRRMADIAQIEKGIETAFIENNEYPLPDSYVNITASGTVFNYQGKFCDTATEKSNIKATPKDPSDSTCYTYETTTGQNKFQLMAFMENTDAKIGFNDNIILAVDYTKRIPSTKGAKLGILVASGTNQPVEDTGSGVDIVNTSTEFVSYFTNTNTIKGTGLVLKSLKNGGELAYGLVGYWSFDEGTGNYIVDNSGKGNNGTCYISTGSTGECGTIGSGIQFVNGKQGLAVSGAGVAINISTLNMNQITINFRFNSTSNYYSGYGNIYEDIIGQWDCSNGNSCLKNNQFPWWIGIYNNNFTFISGGSGWNYTFPLNKYYLITKNKRYNITLTKNGEIFKTYIDGKLYYSKTNAIGILNTSIPLYLLKSGHTNNYGLTNGGYSAGQIDEVRLYNREMSENEVLGLYNSTK